MVTHMFVDNYTRQDDIVLASQCKWWYIDVFRLQLMYLVLKHYNYVIMGAKASQIYSLSSVYSTVYSGVYKRKHQSSASLAFVRGIHRWPVNSPHKGPVTRKMFPFDDVIMISEDYTVLTITNVQYTDTIAVQSNASNVQGYAFSSWYLNVIVSKTFQMHYILLNFDFLIIIWVSGGSMW